MREWTPSIVPSNHDDQTVFLVINNYGKFGTAFAETDLYLADYETTITDLMSGQHCDPRRVVMLNTVADRAEDVLYAIARERWRISSISMSAQTAS